MKLQRVLPILSIVAGLAFCQTAFGQFDRFMDNIGNQARQELGRVIQDAIPNVMPGGGGHHTLPVDPPTTIKPPVIPPVYPPVDPPHCNRPPVYPPVYPVNPPVVRPPVITPPPVVTPTPAGPVPVPAPATTGTIRPVLGHELGHVTRQPSNKNLPSIESGDLVAIESEVNGFGNRRGSVTLSLGGVGLAAVPVSWSPGLVRARMPSLPLGAAAVATVSVHNANMELVEQLDINLTPATSAGDNSATSPSTASIRPASANATPATSTGSAGSTGSTGISPDTGDNLIRAAAIVPVAVSVGKLIWMAGDDFGEEEGTAKVSIGAMSFDADVTSWSQERAGIQLPNLNLTEPVAGQIQLHRANGSLITTMDVQFEPRQSSDSVVRIEQ